MKELRLVKVKSPKCEGCFYEQGDCPKNERGQETCMIRNGKDVELYIYQEVEVEDGE